MKPWKLVPAVAVLLVLLFACSLQSPWNGTTSGGEAGLPADTISDVARSYGEFSYETLLPVQLNLTVGLYESSPGGKSLEPLSAQEHLVLVTLGNIRGEVVFSSRVPSSGNLSAVIPLPAAPEDLTLTLEAPGFQSRSVTIRNMVGLSEVNRVMGLLSDGLAARGDAEADTDGDGIPDVYDAYPLDPDVAFTVRYPAEGSLTVAYEDLFPKPGDADFNDFVAEYWVTENYANAEVVQEVDKEDDSVDKIVLLTNLHGEATAIDKVAGYDHKFGIVIDFPGQTAKSIVVQYYDSYGQPRSRTLAAVQDQAILWLFENTKYAKGKTARFDVYFDGKGVSREKVSYPPHDPVLVVLSSDPRKRYDIHLIGQDPLLGSVNPLGEDFLDDNFFPWALLVPDDWEHPAETQYIGRAYPLFDPWVESKGADFAYWYLYPASTNTKLGNLPPYPVTGPTTTPVFTLGVPATFQLDIASPPGETHDPDGDRVYYRSSEPPSALAGKISLDEDSGLVSFTDTVPSGTYLMYFWSEDEYGASTIAAPYKVNFAFAGEPLVPYSRIVIETYPPVAGSAATDTTLELYDASGLLASDEDNPQVPATHNPSAMIDYVPPAPLASGSVLFVKIYSAKANLGSYSLRALDVPAQAVLPGELPAYTYSELAGINWDDIPYEGYESGLDADPWNDTYAAGEGPARLQPGAATPLHRYLETGADVDWVMIVLP